MAGEVKSAWGIEIGQAGLKAIRLRAGDGDTVRATAFDYIPHPKILSQPDAVPAELIEQAVSTFLERNEIGSDPVGISVPGHTSLAKFIKLPPVEPSKVAEIVQYEAKQQIPFDLDEVVWDFQPIGGGVEESGFMLEAEVGLFAMKRELIYESMRPLMDHGEEVEVVQIAPLALYNYLSWDVLSFRKTEDSPEPPDAEDYYILLDMGADNTTLLVSNGRSIWIRNVPIGGNHFTRALTREMKLTFAKAEHLKCNATRSPDPKSVFQAMRPVFNDYVTEIQRSIGYFGSVNRAAKIKKVIGIGNGFKLAGLQKFLQQNLQYEVERLEHLDGVTGDSVLGDSVFTDNVMTFAVPYGLALQTLNQTRIRTTLLPPEIVTARKIRRKKPWVVGMVASLLVALGISTAVTASVSQSVSEERFASAYSRVKELEQYVRTRKSNYSAQESAHAAILGDIDRIAAPLERRSLWLELFKAINVCLPRDEGEDLDEADVTRQKKIRIKSIATRKVTDVKEWHTAIVDDPNHKESFIVADREQVPTGEGYIVTIAGYHVFQDPVEFRNSKQFFVDKTLGKNLRQWTVEGEGGVTIPVGQLGISHPVIVQASTKKVMWDPNARIGESFSDPTTFDTPSGIGARAGSRGGGGRSLMRFGRDDEEDEESDRSGRRGGQGRRSAARNVGGELQQLQQGAIDELSTEDVQKPVELERTDFLLQFAWVPKLQNERKPAPESPATAVSAP